jgi:NAD(P)-dependent dehydrogenase (short-subunit alcohol dehydrogenase family)
VTGGSRGVGAATVDLLARAGADVVVNYRNKQARAESVAAKAREQGVRALAVKGDITSSAEVAAMLDAVRAELGRIDVLVLNASGGMERDLLAADPGYPMRVNRDAPMLVLETALPLMGPGGVVIHVTSHLAYFYGTVEQVPEYEPVAESKHAGEHALRARQQELAERGIRFAIVSGDLIEDTIVPQLMERRRPGLIAARRSEIGTLPTTADMAEAICRAASEPLATGETLFVGGDLKKLAAGQLTT